MSFPDFFDEVPRITLRDPLAELLGSVTGGLLSYGYADVVRLAGHSCPTVASAYWLGVRGIKALYGDEMPTRFKQVVCSSQAAPDRTQAPSTDRFVQANSRVRHGQ